MNELTARHIAMRERLEELLQEHAALQYAEDQARQSDRMEEGTLADVGFLEREIERLLDHHRKEAKRRQEAIGEQLCLKVMERFQRGDGELKTRGEIANATPDIKQEPIIPSKGDPEYEQIMSHLGVPPELAREGVVSIHFKHMGDYLTELEKSGKNPPSRLRKRAVPRVTYRSNTRKKKDNG